MKIFAISDIHGMYEQFEELLKFWDGESTLVILGDLVDRGPDSYKVVKHVLDLKRAYGEQVVLCMGNHEQMLLDFLADPQANRRFYYQVGGRETMASFARHLDEPPSNPFDLAARVLEVFSDEIALLQSAALFKVIGGVLFTHAGFDSSYAAFSETTPDDLLWIRDHYLVENKTPYVNVFGHTPLPQIHDSADVWCSADQKYIGIDGGCYFSGQLNAVLLTEQGELVQTYSVKR
ncbi:MAG: metallophosphoesterase family protein [Solibacillus sp.]